MSREKISSRDWMSIVYDIADGLLHMHSNGFVHGNLQLCNTLLYKKSGISGCGHFQPIFFSLEKACKISCGYNEEERHSLYEDLRMFQQLVKQILKVVTFDHHIHVFKKINEMISVPTTDDKQSQVLKNVTVYLKNILEQ